MRADFKPPKSYKLTVKNVCKIDIEKEINIIENLINSLQYCN